MVAKVELMGSVYSQWRSEGVVAPGAAGEGGAEGVLKTIFSCNSNFYIIFISAVHLLCVYV